MVGGLRTCRSRFTRLAALGIVSSLWMPAQAAGGDVTETVVRLEETDAAIVYEGHWRPGNTQRDWSGGTAAVGGVYYDTTAWRTRATLTFDGTAVRWIGFRGPDAGFATVWLDGNVVATVDAFASEATVGAVLFTADGLPSMSHRLVIEATGTSNASSSFVYVTVDAFDVRTTETSGPDTTAPTVAMTAPGGGWTSGTITVAANATDENEIAGVQFYVDGVMLGMEDTTAPYAVEWDSTTATNDVMGPPKFGGTAHYLSAVARDAAGNKNSAPPVGVSPTVSETVIRLDESSSAIVYEGNWMQGNTDREWRGGTAAVGGVYDGTSSSPMRTTLKFHGTTVRWIGFRGRQMGFAKVSLDGNFVATVDAYAPEETVEAVQFTADGLASAWHTLVIEATGTSNAYASFVYVVVDAFEVIETERNGSDTTIPTIAIAQPAGGTVSGTIAITADAADNRGVAGVQFYVDGMRVGVEDTTAPYSVEWDTTTATSDGSPTGTGHAITAVARDMAGNRSGAAPVAVYVRNEISTTQDTSTASIAYTGGWQHGNTDRSWTGGTAAVTTERSAEAALRFTGTAVKWVGFRGPQAGIARVLLDGNLVAIVDAYAPEEELHAILYTATGLSAGEHTLRIEVTGDRNIDAFANYIVVDAFEIR